MHIKDRLRTQPGIGHGGILAEGGSVLGLRRNGAPALRSAVAQAANGEVVRYTAELRRCATELRKIDISLTPIRDESGQVVYIAPEGREAAVSR